MNGFRLAWKMEGEARVAVSHGALRTVVALLPLIGANSNRVALRSAILTLEGTFMR